MAGSTNYNTYNTTSTEDYLTNTFQSSISYTTSIGDKCNFSIDMNDNQNMLTHAIELTLPEIAFSVNNIYPFRSGIVVGKPKWYDKISIGLFYGCGKQYQYFRYPAFPEKQHL